MNNQPITFISAGMLRPKKADNILARLHLYLNYGLLGLVSILSDKGFDVRLVHGRFIPPAEFVNYLNQKKWLDTDYPLFLSIPSNYAIGWSKEFCRLVKEQKPELKIVVGGRWVVGTDGRWIKALIPEIDLVVYGTAERRIKHLLYPNEWQDLSFVSSTSISIAEEPLDCLPNLNYSLLDNFEEYQPSIEVSRGCGMGCSFCAERDISLSKFEEPSRVISKIIECCEKYRQNNIRPYFEASLFRPTYKWAKEFEVLYRSLQLTVQWRCESRVDALSPFTLHTLASAGLKVIDLGLESASFRQLVAMNKTTNPEAYLKRASTFLKECKKAGVWVKVNVLLYPGETYDSIKETLDWLSAHQECIKGVSVGPLVVYRYDAGANSYLNSLRILGACAVDPDSLEREGIAKLHLSREIDCETAEVLSTRICQQFMSERDYFDLKGFSYLPRTYSFTEFLQTVSFLNPSNIPFKIS